VAKHLTEATNGEIEHHLDDHPHTPRRPAIRIGWHPPFQAKNILVFDLVHYFDGISTRIKKRLESLSWITIYTMMLEVNKYDEKLMQLEMVADVGNGMIVARLQYIRCILVIITTCSRPL
jgi:hypothetical protein